MDKRKQKHKVVRNSELPNEFEQINHQESIINHEEAMLIDSDSRESITINQKDQWTEMEQSIQAALMDSNNNNSVEITQNIDNAGVQGLDVREVDNDMISVNTINIDYGEDSEIGEKNDKKDHHETVKQKKSGYNVIQATDWGSNHKEEFNSSFGTESNKACAIAWKSLSEPDKQKYEEKTSLEEMKEVQFDYIENSRKRHAQAQSDINNIKNTICCMEKKCGLEVAMLIVPSRSNDSFSSTFIGTNSGEAFFSASPEMYPLLDKFEIFSKNRYLEQTGQIVTPPAKRIKRELSTTPNSTSKYNDLSHSPIVVSSTHRNINSADVKARVRAILRARYNSALGTEGLIIPYKKWKDHQGEIEVIGWPSDVPFDDFGVLKVAQKKQILDCLYNISFRKKDDKIVLN
ncbi:hypothetical protein GLOIN_2v1520291 [Rhizophagus irregularis DAOM 181602=DAOM 197198]|uniref:Uncharacterized protein n=1 Tax=Rhizophagus irregularis (strain DAOM 181602 / DAOM 197198 / MUCL 43194) TaxID=747089 RepID=A0A2P4QRP0_RHIID|nr:hypothetical protein GLOIN_2v1520291 [Rhizophagus irregularis DAOM 181602=DAOM 197198]POG80290.1 hypothetical protein GLOIN_2v1520291 [Rhizophagus irregularis DAOM 181602=DAOM 197198]|eukprot:XP_025187156.1 hypothetical protein GLOIN_2v1520291 [Rhizophagus irregularis DAOM 181602=DAOM 197198]